MKKKIELMGTTDWEERVLEPRQEMEPVVLKPIKHNSVCPLINVRPVSCKDFEKVSLAQRLPERKIGRFLIIPIWWKRVIEFKIIIIIFDNHVNVRSDGDGLGCFATFTSYCWNGSSY